MGHKFFDRAIIDRSIVVEMSDANPSAFHDFEQAGWERAAEHYADAFGALTSQTADALLDAAHVTAGTRLLDVACGPGFMASAAASRGAQVTGLDFSPAMIAAAQRRHGSSVAFRDGDAEALPFEDASFDAVVMNFGMLHLARPEAAIVEALRVLRPGGRYAFTVWAPPERAVGFGMALRAIREHGNPDVPLPEGPPFFRFSDADECRRTLQTAGFADVDVRGLPLVWRLSSADAAFAALSRGGVRTAAVLRAQTPAALATIRAAVRREVETYAAGDEFAVPMPAVLACASAP
jgi:SAM-dependent methyltransferase